MYQKLSLKRNQRITKNTRFLVATFILMLWQNGGMAQDSILHEPIARIKIESGVFFPQSDSIRQLFKTESAFSWGLGLEFGNTKWRVLPSFGFSTFEFSNTIITEPIDSINPDAPLEFKKRLLQFSAGLSFPIPLKNEDQLIFRGAIVNNLYWVTGSDSSTEAGSFLMSASYYRKLNRNSHFFLTTSYAYNKNSTLGQIKDWSGLSLNMGLSFNLAGSYEE